MIGILDSGMGGLTTLAALVRSGADRSFCYYADVAHAPYGNRPEEEVLRAVRRGVGALAEKGAERVVLACNTATLAAGKGLKCTINVPVYGVTPPVEEARERGGKTLLLGTALTCRHYPEADDFRALTMPALATLIDRDYPRLDRIEAYCAERLKDVGTADNLVLGCTHYILIEDMLRRLTGAKRVLDGNAALVKQLGKAAQARGETSIAFIGSGTFDEGRYRRATERMLA